MGLQNSVRTNRNGVQRHIYLGKQAHHCYATVARAINDIECWKKIETATETIYRGEIAYKPFIKAHKEAKSKEPLKTHRLVVSIIERKDKQVNLFTNEACIYSAIITNDHHKNVNDVVFFYNQRGTIAKEFDILKNDFGWRNLPFSKLEQNTVFMIFTAICRNLYHHIITLFSEKREFLKANFRINKFIFRFITISAKWIKTSRQYKLRIYGNLHFKT